MSDRTSWYRRVVDAQDRHPTSVDVGICVASFVGFTAPALFNGRGLWVAVAVFGVLAVAPLAVRRRWPVGALAAVTAVEVGAALTGVRFTPFVSNAGPVVPVAVFTLADRRGWRASLAWSVSSLVAIDAASRVGLRLHPELSYDAVQVFSIPAWLLGDSLRRARESRSRLAEQRRERGVERDARIRAEERLRVSREVHDVVSHTLSVIAVRAGVARLLLDRDPQQIPQALSAIETTSRSALQEVRAVLRSTREEPTRELDEPRLADLARLLEATRAAGLAVDYTEIGEARGYDPLLEASAFRVVQEALTNVVKHAIATRANVDIEHDPGELRVRVCDDGRAEPNRSGTGQGTGLGLVGMRERLALFGGTLQAGPRPGGGFAVTASFPTGGDNER